MFHIVHYNIDFIHITTYNNFLKHKNKLSKQAHTIKNSVPKWILEIYLARLQTQPAISRIHRKPKLDSQDNSLFLQNGRFCLDKHYLFSFMGSIKLLILTSSARNANIFIRHVKNQEAMFQEQKILLK